jgi:hypothetical protein
MLNMIWLAGELYDEVLDILEALEDGSYYADPPPNERNFPEPHAFDSAYAGGGN